MDDGKPRHPDQVRGAIAAGTISKAELARRADVHPNTLAGVADPAWAPRWPTLQRLCQAVEGESFTGNSAPKGE